MLVAVERTQGRGRWAVEASLEELAQLARSAGAEVLGRLVQRLPRPTLNYYLGKGKLWELVELREETGYTLVIFDDELTPLQQRNAEEALGVKVIDRTALILDIFARHARTHEGRLQVELAQHQYLLPRLVGQWSHLERLGGGIGTRGPGEAQLETDRRLIRQRIHRLKAEIEGIRRHRALYRKRRQRERMPLISLVGYTNAGKSTLFNALTRAEVLVDGKLFATLDPTTRCLRLPDQQEVLMTDTVGFIQKLPPTVVAAFRATLEELQEADLLLHIVDITHLNAVEQAATVEETLLELGLAEKPRLTLLNKADLLAKEKEDLDAQRMQVPLAQIKDSALIISAAKGWGLEALLERIQATLRPLLIPTSLRSLPGIRLEARQRRVKGA